MTTSAVSSSDKSTIKLRLPAHKGDEILGMVLLAGVLLLLGALISYHPLDPSWLHRATAQDVQNVRNVVGPIGAQIAASMVALLGLASFLFPALLSVEAWRRLARPDREDLGGRIPGLVAIFFTLPPLLQLLFGQVAWRAEPVDAGGALGSLIHDVLLRFLHTGGTLVVLVTVLLVGASLAVQTTFGELVTGWRRYLGDLWRWLILQWGKLQRRREDRAMHRRVVEQGRKAPEGGIRIRRPGSRAAEGRVGRIAPAASTPKLDLPLRVQERKGEGHFGVRKVAVAEPRVESPATSQPSQRRTSSSGASPAPTTTASRPRSHATTSEPDGIPPRQEAIFTPEEIEPPELPPVNLLDTSKPKQYVDEDDLVAKGEKIQKAAQHFGVDGKIAGISPGPVITVFEFQPAPGVKVSKIVNLQDDLALALKADSVRIDRIPGRSTMGMEVPNTERSVIHLGQLLADTRFQKAKSPLTMAMGVDIHGEPVYQDLATMPHLLVAGATGAGKSVGLQSMITSIVYRAAKENVKFIFIDPKRVELGVYSEIPHLKTEVVVDPKKAANALRWAVAEMERRYRLLADVHVRSIDIYNKVVSDPKERRRLALRDGAADTEVPLDQIEPLPYYVIIIDELADLMMVSSSEVEASIARLAQMARAVGIHLIIATQRPSVDVLTGTIKANFPCRLAFATATRHDSRTILDTVGAEKLLGRGDALFMPPGTSRIQRIHGAYISEQETAALVRWLKRRGKPDLDPEVVKDPESETTGGSSGAAEDDPLYDEAARLVVKERQASASFLQRRMRVGFSRAARLVDMLEADGLLGPAQGSKPREVLVPVDYFDEIADAHAAVGD
ncbi:MAG: DNA translocase FtsK [Thermoanaerobaculia bacterium]|nr:DNA translocase FtsK [Thermoanaerobaculia bacterium]